MPQFTRPTGVPADATVDDQGNWFTAGGDFIISSKSTGPTDAQKRVMTDGTPQTDPKTGKQFVMRDGQRWYLPPMAHADGTPFAPGETNNPGGGGGLIHGGMQWNGQTGEFDAPIDWGKILSMVAAGVITAGAADAALAASPELASSASVAGTSGSAATDVTATGVGATGGVAPGLPGAGTALGGTTTGAASGAGAAADGAFMGPPDTLVDATAVPADGGALSSAEKLAQLAKGLKGVTDGVSTIVNNGQDPNLVGVGAANAAAQAARNRILGAQVDQNGPTADGRALANMRQAGLTANFKDTAPSPYGSPGIVIGDSTRNFASQFSKELQDRMNAGKSLTLSGVPDPTPQELADEATARAVSQGKSAIPGKPGAVINGINTGARVAGLVPGIVKGAKSIWDLFGSGA